MSEKSNATEIRKDCRLCEKKWHTMTVQEVFSEIQSQPEGLSDHEVANRLAIYGSNTLPAKKPPTIWEILLHQILNPLIFILFSAAIASLFIGEAVDAIFILVVITLNTSLGAYQEFQAEKSAASLQQLLTTKAKVRRNGREAFISADQLVPGDIVLLESGVKVPADLRLLQQINLASDESFLTGESIASEKQTDTLSEDTTISDRKNMVFAGSSITSGRGIGVTVGTGLETQVGIIAETVTRSESGKPPLVMRMEKFVKDISVFILLISAVLAAILWTNGYDTATIFFLIVALAVSAIPEGLPVSLTVALSIATKRMSARNVIVRKLTAVESLGSCTVIASDKTGTLTVNQQTARSIVLPDGQQFSVSGEGYNGEGEVSAENDVKPSEQAMNQLFQLAEAMVLTNEGSLFKENENWTHDGDAMDVAFLSLSYKLGLTPAELRRRYRIFDEIPYESEQKFSAAFYEKDNVRQVAAKGATETILGFCDRMMWNNAPAKINRGVIEQQAEAMAAKGLRVLAVAGGEAIDDDFGQRQPSRLIFHGLVGFIDPLRPEVFEAVKKCKSAGIKVIMITGDHPSTAAAIANELGLTGTGERVVTGLDLNQAGSKDSQESKELVASTHVFARVSPTQKLEIVDVLIRSGEFVAVTGDGVNDAPALKRANIGVAMGSGTDVAKEVGSMIVIDDNFASIVAGVEEGRYAYDNVRKVTYLLISTGAAELLLFLASIVAGLPIPLLAVQLLWLNLVTNGIQDVALAFEGGEPGAMKRPPRRPEEKIFDPQMILQTLTSGTTTAIIGFGLWFWLIRFNGMDEYSARNMLFLLMVLVENIHVFNCRSEKVSALLVPISRNYILIIGVFVAHAIHIISMNLPFMQAVLKTEPVTPSQYLSCFLLASIVLASMEMFKLIRKEGRFST